MTIAEKLTRAKDDIDAVYQKGYDKGLAEGGSQGGGDTSEADEMMRTTADNWGGNDFYSLFKWLEVTQTNFSAFPFMYSVMNKHPTLYIHLYIVANVRYEVFDEETGDSVGYEDVTEYYTLTVPPDKGEASLDIDQIVSNLNVEGIRWSEDGV